MTEKMDKCADAMGTGEGEEEREAEGSPHSVSNSDILYSVEETPPWHLTVLLGFQHYLTAFGAIISVPLVLSEYLCMDEDIVGISELIGTIFFVAGICTLIQTAFGVRLPIVQGGTLSFVTPTIAILLQPKWSCPYREARLRDGPSVNFTALDLPEVGSEEHREMWRVRLREVQGAIMVASCFQMFMGFSGLMGFLLRFIGPLSITPTITLIGLSLFPAAANLASKQWWIAIMTIFLIVLFSQYLRNINIPCLTVSRERGCHSIPIPIFCLFPVLLAMVIAWSICAILTKTEVLPSDPNQWGYEARTDIKLSALDDAEWFRVPYPGQWGMPTVSLASVFGIMAGVLASMVESIGDYYACARLSMAPPPPVHAVNRGIGMEGFGCFVAGLIGSGNGTTSYSHNIATIGLTKVGSRRVVQVGGCVMILMGCLGKFGALFSTIPSPVIGGMFLVTFGMISSVGLTNLQYINMDSSRNIFIVGVSLYLGISLPTWMQNNDVINTGSEVADQIFTVLLRTSMLVGGVVGFVLDNTIPGTEAERGIKTWRTQDARGEDATASSGEHLYDLPLIQGCLDGIKCLRYVPFCPAFMRKRPSSHDEENAEKVGHDNPMVVVNGMEKGDKNTHL